MFIKNAGSSSSFQICGQMLSWKELLCRDSRTLDVNPDRDLRLFVAVLVQSPSHVQLCGPVHCSMPGLPDPPYCSKFSQVDVLHRWCHPAVSSSVALFSFCPQSSRASGTFPVSQLLASGDQTIGASASASVLPTSIQGWFPLRLTGLIFLLSKGLSRVFSNTTVQNQFFGSLPLWCSSSHTCTWLLERLYGPLSAKWCLVWVCHSFPAKKQ